MTCQRCADAPAQFIRQHLWTCDACAAKLDARGDSSYLDRHHTPFAAH